MEINNKFMIGGGASDGVQIVNPPRALISKNDALNLIAHLKIRLCISQSEIAEATIEFNENYYTEHKRKVT